MQLACGPRNVSHGKIAADGAYYVTGNDARLCGVTFWAPGLISLLHKGPWA
jgi:hypothetical protein